METIERKMNDETMSALSEASLGKYAGKLYVESFDSFMKSLNEIE